MIKGVVDYSSKDVNPKSDDRLTKEFATSKVESYRYFSKSTEFLVYVESFCLIYDRGKYKLYLEKIEK